MPSLQTRSIVRAMTAQDLSSLPLQAFGAEFTAGPWTLTLSNLVRGADAAAQIAAVTDQNDPPGDGIDYVLFQVNATNAGKERIWIDYDDFAMFGSSGIVRRSLELLPPIRCCKLLSSRGNRPLVGWWAQSNPMTPRR